MLSRKLLILPSKISRERTAINLKLLVLMIFTKMTSLLNWEICWMLKRNARLILLKQLPNSQEVLSAPSVLVLKKLMTMLLMASWLFLRKVLMNMKRLLKMLFNVLLTIWLNKKSRMLLTKLLPNMLTTPVKIRRLISLPLYRRFSRIMVSSLKRIVVNPNVLVTLFSK